MANTHLTFDIDLNELDVIRSQLNATREELHKAYGRALKRTSVTMQKLSRQLIRDEMRAKSIKAINERVQTFRIKRSKMEDELKLWFGLNDLTVSLLKGRLKRLGSKKHPRGARFIPSGSALSPQQYDKGFIAKIRKTRSIYTRVGKGQYALEEGRVAVSDDLEVSIEDDIFEQLPEVFMHHFTVDLAGRVASRK